MKKFNKSFMAGRTIVQFFGKSSRWHIVTEVHETKNWIKVKDLAGSFQREHVQSYSNNTNSLYKKNELLNYRSDSGSLYELQNNNYVHVYRNDRLQSTEALLKEYKQYLKKAI